MNSPVKFFGVPMCNITSIDDATNAVENFCRRATPAEVSVARRELRNSLSWTEMPTIRLTVCSGVFILSSMTLLGMLVLPC